MGSQTREKLGETSEIVGLIVQKYGGTSVGSTERIKNVARRIAKFRSRGHQVVVVVSAMSGETNRLIALAKEFQANPDPRELDVMVSTGEQVTVALLSMALMDQGVKAKSYTGAQVRILTDSAYTKARILKIDEEKIRADLDEGYVVVVAGFQGVDDMGSITTLGRGGSDTTGVALAAALKADECQIYTDVDGVYTTDPRIVPEARKLATITFEEMLEMASLGSKVLQIRSVEFAGKYKVKLRVLSSFEEEGEGTLITFEEDEDMERAIISGIAFSRDEAKITVLGVPDRPGIAYQILGPVADANIDVDMIIQNVGHDGMTDFSFTRQSERVRANHGYSPEPGSASYRRTRRYRWRQNSQGICCRRGHAFACRHRQHNVPRTCGRGHQYPDDFDLRNQDLGRGRREIHGACSSRVAQGIRIGSGVVTFGWVNHHSFQSRRPSFDRAMVKRYSISRLWRDGRVVEGAPLLREYRLKRLIEGSNPSLSAKINRGVDCAVNPGDLRTISLLDYSATLGWILASRVANGYEEKSSEVWLSAPANATLKLGFA